MTKNKFTWKVGGEAGSGTMTTGVMMGKLLVRGGLFVFGYPEYPSLIRGGHNSYQVHCSNEPVTSQIHEINLLVALHRETIDQHLSEMSAGGAIIYDEQADDMKDLQIERKDVKYLHVPLMEITKDVGGNPVMRNTVALGASVGLLDYSMEKLMDIIEFAFIKKGDKVVKQNQEVAKQGYEFAKEKYADDFEWKAEVQEDFTKRMYLTGNDAIVAGAIRGGLQMYCAYPMTPASGILHGLAANEELYNIVVKHTEDELAAMNMAIGGNVAGVRTMTGTSGGGFALMTEAFGMAGINEAPLVAVEVQRAGPSTGLPTWTAQADLRFVLHASHGDFPRILITPGDANECFEHTVTALNLAEIYQLPVLILSDKYVGASHQTVDTFDESWIHLDRGKLIAGNKAPKNYLRYELTPDGISPRAVPGQKGGEHIASSYEHDETGFTTEDPDMTIKQNDKRYKKIETLIKENADLLKPIRFGLEEADVTIISWGSTKLPILEALKLFEDEGMKVNFYHYIYIAPFPVTETKRIMETSKKTFLIEGNKTAQFGSIIKENTGYDVDEMMLCYTGRPFYPEDIFEEVKKII
ncbi:MAG: 2-oxoacid:acceptor oxidoreductase subunit alpha [bacterium]